MAELAGVLVDRGEPLLYTGSVEQSHRARAEAGGDESLSAGLSLVTDPTEHAAGVLAGLGDQGVVLQEGPRGARGGGGGGGLLP